ncbi:sigma-70 family RNA polymerase sigma factor [Micromonospora sp. WMMA1363]|uniref:sigma-70 family RNA polymerase sigma factor n=1 Tax=Micromonospora sp. WMMA1363 TaxID=3053985 RepID=UPI00259D259E|nr:sigma-70 family RNA polymerase sigma factor [Micromonospora sp. WMMA1363]MDM4719844.1 sigma-70 family RNA polymerase sigma factor [Micromonospora sp. WMMA1363]
MARLRAGDESAFASIYESHGDAVFATALWMTEDRQLAADVTQEVFIALWERPDRYEPERGALRLFLIVVTRRRAIDLLRSRVAARQREARHGLAEVSGPDPSEQVEARLKSAAVRAAVEQLPDEQRRVVELVYYGGLSHRQVAARLGIPEGTAKSRVRLALARLRGTLHQREGVSWI